MQPTQDQRARSRREWGVVDERGAVQRSAVKDDALVVRADARVDVARLLLWCGRVVGGAEVEERYAQPWQRGVVVDPEAGPDARPGEAHDAAHMQGRAVLHRRGATERRANEEDAS